MEDYLLRGWFCNGNLKFGLRDFLMSGQNGIPWEKPVETEVPHAVCASSISSSVDKDIE